MGPYKGSFALTNPPTFSSTSDYALYPRPTYVVVDQAAAGANFINQVSCFIAQLRIKDSFYDSKINPNRLPYTALVDMHACDPTNSNINIWYVDSSGPSNLGDGTYKTTIAFPLNGVAVHVTLLNKVVNQSDVLSQLYYNSGECLCIYLLLFMFFYF